MIQTQLIGISQMNFQKESLRMYCDCTDLKMMKTFLVYDVCVCLHFIFTECFQKKNYKLKKWPCWKYTQRNNYFTHRLASCLIWVSTWSKKQVGSIYSHSMAYINVARTRWTITYCVIKQFECNPQRVHACNLRKCAKTEKQSVCVASVKYGFERTRSLHFQPRNPAPVRQKWSCVWIDLNGTCNILISVFCTINVH